MSQAWQRSLFSLAVAALLLLAVHELSSILLPFVLGAVIAFLLNPMVERLVRLKVSRTGATLVALTVFFLGFVVFILLLAPLLEVQIAQLVNHVPDYLSALRRELDTGFQLLHDRLADEDIQRLRDAAGAKLGDLLGGTANLATSLLTGGVAVANVLSLIFITPIVTFFLLRDWTLIIETLDDWMPRPYLSTIRDQATLINETLSGFVRGQASVCLLMGAVYAVGLTIIGLESGAVVGFCVGILIFIPFLGGIASALVAVALSVAQFGLWQKPVWVIILFAAGQALEGNIITPKLVGDRVHLHPVWIIFSLLAFGALFGFLGVLIAVPVAAVLGVLVRFALHIYLESPLYDPLKGRR